MTGALENLLGAGEIRRLAESIGLRPTKTLGQNFVHDANTVRRLIEVSGVGPGDHVLEVGPGLGSLTLGLVQAAGAVTAVEIDSRLAELLPATARAHLGDTADRLTVVAADALRIAADDIPAAAIGVPTALVANLPYNVAVPVLLHLLATIPTLRTMLVMVQAEVADRLAAPPGSRTYGSPSVKLAWYGSARRAGSVSRSIFWPVPGVDSALVSWTRTPPPRDDITAGEVFAVIDAAFAQRRKTMRSALARWAGSPATAEIFCRAAGIEPTARGESLDVAAFAALAAARAARAAGAAEAAEAAGTEPSDVVAERRHTRQSESRGDA